MARTKKFRKQLPRKSKPMEKGKKGGSKTIKRRNDKKIQKKSAVQENVDQNENILERSVHPNEMILKCFIFLNILRAYQN